MSKHIQLTIADPCHENWDNMTQADKGRFCASCQKQVVDFTNMSDSQLAAFFKKPSKGSVCGRLFQDQLERRIEIPKKRIPWVKYFFQFALPAFLVSMKATAQGNVRMGKPAIVVPSKKKKVTKHDLDTIPSAALLIAPARISALERNSLSNVPVTRPTDVASCIRPELTQLTGVAGGISVQHFSTARRHSLKGEVLDEKGRRIPYASIKLENNSYSIYSDRKGKFYLPRWVKDSDSVIINVHSEGYQEKQVMISTRDRRDKIIIRLESIKTDKVVEVEMQISPSGDTKSIRVLQQELMDNASRLSKLSPNPVQRSNTFYLGFNSDQEETMQLSLISLSGDIVLTQSKKIIRGYNYLSVKTDPQWAAGIYLVKLSNQKGTVIQQEKLVVQ